MANKGMPQGLPHTYFMANIFMLMVQEKYKIFFLGKMLFYVDDSVIFTNGAEDDITENSFIESVKSLNQEILACEQDLLDRDKRVNWILPKDYCYNTNDYGVHVHDAETENSFALFHAQIFPTTSLITFVIMLKVNNLCSGLY